MGQRIRKVFVIEYELDSSEPEWDAYFGAQSLRGILDRDEFLGKGRTKFEVANITPLLRPILDNLIRFCINKTVTTEWQPTEEVLDDEPASSQKNP